MVQTGSVVLVVEDDPEVAALLAEVLAGAGYAPTTTNSALGAVALAKRLRPVVLVLDLGLPYRSGGALLDDLQADPATAALPVVVVSAFADALPPARRARVASVLDKPFSPAALVAAVRAAAGRPPAGAGGRPAAGSPLMPRLVPVGSFAAAPFAAGPELSGPTPAWAAARGRRRGLPSAPSAVAPSASRAGTSWAFQAAAAAAATRTSAGAGSATGRPPRDRRAARRPPRPRTLYAGGLPPGPVLKRSGPPITRGAGAGGGRGSRRTP